MRKVEKNSPTPYSISFLSALHQNKALHKFNKRGQRSMVERNIGLEYIVQPPNGKSYPH